MKSSTSSPGPTARRRGIVGIDANGPPLRRPSRYTVDRLRHDYSHLLSLITDYQQQQQQQCQQRQQRQQRQQQQQQQQQQHISSSRYWEPEPRVSPRKLLNSLKRHLSKSVAASLWIITGGEAGTAPAPSEIDPKSLQAAYHTLSATITYTSHTPALSSLHFVQGDSQVQAAQLEAAAAYAQAKALEHEVVSLLDAIGGAIIEAVKQQQQRAAQQGKQEQLSSCHEIFEYFCEKAMLAVWVAIIREKPNNSSSSNNNNNNNTNNKRIKGDKEKQQQDLHDPTASQFCGLVWSTQVKAKALAMIAALMSTLRDDSSLYYVLSQNCLNELISSMIPLSQWTDPALEKMLPPFVDLMRHLALVLSDSPHLFCFFVVQHRNQTLFPLFSATLHTATSAYAQSNSFVHATCLNLIVDLMQIEDSSIQDWVQHASQPEQVHLAHHLCDLLLSRYSRMAKIVNGPVVDAIRSHALATQLQGLNDQLDLLNDVFDCHIRGLNVRLCEQVLKRVIRVLWKTVVYGQQHQQEIDHTCLETRETDVSSTIPLNLGGRQQQSFLPVGLWDGDVIPKREASAQMAFFVLATFFHRIRYRPLIRMLAVALFHPHTTDSTLWDACVAAGKVSVENEKDTGNMENDDGIYPHSSKEQRCRRKGDTDDFSLTRTLHQIAQNDTLTKSTDDAIEAPTNLFRDQVQKAISGTFGEWFVLTSTILLENVIVSPSLDAQTLDTVEILSPCTSDDSRGNDFDTAIKLFLERDHSHPFGIFTLALECASSLALHFIHKSVSQVIESGSRMSIDSLLSSSRALAGLRSIKDFFCKNTIESLHAVDGDYIFLDVMESAVLSLYKPVSLFDPNSGQPRSAPAPASKRVYAYQLSHHVCSVHGGKAQSIIRRLWDHADRHRHRHRHRHRPTEVELACWKAQMALHMRATLRVLDRFMKRAMAQQLSLPRTPSKQDTVQVPLFPKLVLLDQADELEQLFGTTLHAKLANGTFLKLHGRTTFRFQTTGATTTVAENSSDAKSPSKRTPQFKLLVLDPSELLLVKPLSESNKTVNLSDLSSVGTLICRISLLHVIAAARDGACLHVAVRHENVASLIKNGNMALHFESVETSALVQNQLLGQRQEYRRQVAQRTTNLLTEITTGPNLASSVRQIQSSESKIENKK